MQTPSGWERSFTLEDGLHFHTRPIGPADATAIRQLLLKTDPVDLRLRFFDTIKEFPNEFIEHLTRLDYKRAMAFVAIEDGAPDIIGTVRLHHDPDGGPSEFAILIRSDLKNKGLGRVMMSLMIEYAMAAGVKTICGTVLIENAPMLNLCRQLGFDMQYIDTGEYLVTLDLSNHSRVAAQLSAAS